MIEISVLVLDDPLRYKFSECQEWLGIFFEEDVVIHVTAEPYDNRFDANGLHSVSEGSLEWIREAILDEYQAIFIGNNLSTGYPRALEIPDSLKGATMITWRSHTKHDTHKYVRFGFNHFSDRANLEATVKFLKSIIRPTAT